jgi:hypothetical protein|tara:strand:- start:278 stop:517 length:240 start_codon:yes stop_codon:yes gene_type:complete
MSHLTRIKKIIINSTLNTGKKEMLKSFMKTKGACGTGITIGAVGALTAVFNFDPIQLVVSITLLLTELMILLELIKEED